MVLVRLLVLVAIGQWLLKQKRALFRVIVVTTAVLTFGPLTSVRTLVTLLLAAGTVLMFSIWYCVIDPRGSMTRSDEARREISCSHSAPPPCHTTRRGRRVTPTI